MMDRYVGRIGWRLIFSLVPLIASAAYGADGWHGDLDHAKRLAAQQGKDLLINFTGTEWCGACIEFERDVLSKREFAPAHEAFVLVELEFPASTDSLPDAIREKYVAWRDQYHVRAFPTVFLADPTGRPYAVTGHIEIGASAYVRHLQKLAQGRKDRDAALSKAEQSQGLERARHLDEALSVVRKSCNADYVGDNGDPLVQFYRQEIDEICALDATNAARLKSKYDEILSAETERQHVAAIHGHINTIYRQEGFEAANRLIEDELQRAKSPEFRYQLRRSRQVFLEWSQRNDEALVIAKQLSTDEGISAEDRRHFRSRVAFNLCRLGRIDEAIVVYDQLIADVADDPRAALRYHRQEADQLKNAGRLDEAIATYESARKLVKPGSADWLLVEILRGRLLIRAGRNSEAVEAFDLVLKAEGITPVERAMSFADLSVALHNVGRQQAALKQVSLAEAMLPEIESDAANQSVVDYVRSRLKLAQAVDAKADPP